MLALIPLFPLIGFLINASLGRRVPKTVSGGVASLVMLASFAVAAMSVWQLAGLPVEERIIDQTLYTWIASGDFVLDLTLRLDPLSAVMILVITGIGSLIHIYSTAYMHDEPDSEYARYFSYLNLFAAFMLVLVLGASFLVLFVGWEGVGLCSYLLIGFWFKKKSAADAGKKAFVVNRIGDYAFILGTLLLFTQFGTLDFHRLAEAVGPLPIETTFGTLSIATLLLFIGATGKSAQIPLYVWLPDAMEGPTPVSALIHAATMVTAGVYMIGRTAVVFTHAPDTMLIVAIVGGLTALMAGTIGLVQNDIKRVLAYSTVSQLGYMFLAMGMGAFGAGIFHLYTHAFFKALLFLGSGAVIHALHGEQDIRNMGGLRKQLPVTYWTFLLGSLAIAGVPFLSGFFSKDEILFETFAHGHWILWLIGVLTSLLTATYMFRLVFLTFHGERREGAIATNSHQHDSGSHQDDAGSHQHDPGSHRHDSGSHLHDAPPAMAIVLILLAVGAVLAGYVGVPHALGGSNLLGAWLEPAFGVMPAAGEEDAGLELMLMAVSSAIALVGIGLAAFIWLKRREIADGMARSFAGLYNLLLNKYYVDEFYDAAIVQPIVVLSREGLWHGFDVHVIDAAVNGTGTIVGASAWMLRRLQTGSVRTYASSLFLGVVLILGYYLWEMMPLLTLSWLVPLAGGVLLLLVGNSDGRRDGLIKWLTLGVSLVAFAVTLALWAGFDSASSEFQFVERHPWIPAFGIDYFVGIDGISLLLVVLTAFLTPIALLSSWGSIDRKVKEFSIFMLALEAAMIGVFISLDLFLFYVFWDAMLIPMYFLIGIWGYDQRIYAAIKFMLYTMAGSVLMLVAILGLAYLHSAATGSYSFDLLKLYTLNIAPQTQMWFFLAFAIAFAIKVPLFPFHTWLPDAHVQAPTAGSVILAGVLLKMGTYGLVRFAFPLFPIAAAYFAPWLALLAVIGIIYGALVAMVQPDMKKLVAYSSVSHLGFVVLGICAMNVQGLQGAVYQMLAHGVSTGGLFLMVGMLSDRRHTRLISEYGGLKAVVPRLTAAFMIITLASIGLPGLNGFIGEFLILLGAFRWDPRYVVGAGLGVILSAVYMLWMFQRVFYGEVTNHENESLPDLQPREWAAVLPLCAMAIVMGVFPVLFLKPMEPAVQKLVQRAQSVQTLQVNTVHKLPVKGPIKLVKAGD